jgi:hypothetical protein
MCRLVPWGRRLPSDAATRWPICVHSPHRVVECQHGVRNVLAQARNGATVGSGEGVLDIMF